MKGKKIKHNKRPNYFRVHTHTFIAQFIAQPLIRLVREKGRIMKRFVVFIVLEKKGQISFVSITKDPSNS